ncbi:hypothetical protein PFISCL1PPCAC_18956, partial [Pristionchus fissidentatus]
FSNENEKQSAAPLVIYAVDISKDPNWSSSSGVFDAADLSSGVQSGMIVTILSVQPFTTTINGDASTIATIFATGFDNADSNDKNPDKCRRILQDRFIDGTPVSFQINGPIASIYFRKLFNSKNNIKTSLTFAYDNLDLKSRGFVTSQGYVGC